MSASFQKTLFEPFSRERRPETAEISGTGLGLSIVKNLVDAMGGTISVKSQTGSGSAFIIDFTADFTTREASARAASDACDDRAKVEQRLAGKRVLVCEDNRINAEIVQRLLAEKGVDADIAYDGREGVQRFSESRTGYYNALLMDVRMPEMDGRKRRVPFARLTAPMRRMCLSSPCLPMHSPMTCRNAWMQE